MAENLLPKPGDPTRGLPYYEKLKRDLRDTIQRKRMLDKSMTQLEEQIYRFETNYFEETPAGNIIKGFDNYIKGSTASTGGGASGGGSSTRRKGGFVEQDRVFSRSSVSFTRESSPASALNTPSGGPTPLPTSGHVSTKSTDHATPMSATSQKGSVLKRSKKAVEKEEYESDSKPVKRLKITYARGEKGD